MKNLFSKNIFLGLFILIVVLFFKPFFWEGKIPLPADSLVGMYHPFRDFFVNQYPRGFPFKNFLITDPVRQQYPWRSLVIKSWQKGQFPGWNPYQFTGTPLLANFQSAAFYPLNFFFFLLPFPFAWGILIVLQPLLAALFLYLFLRNLNLGKEASFLGSLCFGFCGFSVAWLEWGTIGHTVLWLPLILLSIDKIVSRFQEGSNSKFQFKIKNYLWETIFILSLTNSFFAGHLQTAFYVILFSVIYLVWKILQFKDKQKIIKLIILFSILYSLFSILTFPQWLSTLQFIKLSAREVDLDWQKPGWFLPWKHLIQFLIPDFFGNPTTLNYWGEWNYGEFVSYLGVIPLVLVFFAVLDFFKKSQIRFFLILALISLSFALPTPLSKIVYQAGIPFLKTSQPTRLIFLVDFSFSVLAAIGLEKLLKKEKRLFSLLILSLFLFSSLFLFVRLGIAGQFGPADQVNYLVSQRNLLLPFGLLIGFLFLSLSFFWGKLSSRLLLVSLLFLIAFDLLRFTWKFIPFSPQNFIFPTTRAIEFLKNQAEDQPPFRIMSLDKKILPPNTASFYQLQEVGGYDPLYLLRFGQLIAASEREKPDISPPFGFSRIIVPEKYDSPLINFLNVKFLLSLNELSSPKLKLVFQEGETRIYENKNFLPRAFLVYDYRLASSRQEAVNYLISDQIDFRQTIILEEKIPFENVKGSAGGQVKILDYQPNQIILETQSPTPALLVLSDAFYPNWQAFIDGQKTKIYRANYHYRSLILPSGQHQIKFSFSPISLF